MLETMTPLVQQWDQDKWDEIVGSDTFWTDFLYYQFFTFDGLPRSALFTISWMRWEWGWMNEYYRGYNNNSYNTADRWFNFLFNDNFLIGWVGFCIVVFMRPEFLWIFTDIFLFSTTMRLMNRYWGTGYCYWGGCATSSDYYNHYNALTWTTWGLSVLMAAA